MKKLTVSIGLGALAVASMLSACDKNRPMWNAHRPADTTANNRHEKLRCESPFKLNLAAVQAQRLEKLAKNDSAKIVITNSSNDEARLKADFISPGNAKEVETAKANLINVDLDCENLTAMVSLGQGDSNSDSVAQIVKIDTNKMVFRRITAGRPVQHDLNVNDQQDITDHDELITISIDGIEQGQNAGDLSKEDGINKIRVEIADTQTEYQVPPSKPASDPSIDAKATEAAPAQDNETPVKVGTTVVTTIITSETVADVSNLSEHEVFAQDLVEVFAIPGIDKKLADVYGRLDTRVSALALKTEGQNDTQIAEVVKDPSNLQVEKASGEIIVSRSAVVKVGLRDLQEVSKATGLLQLLRNLPFNILNN